MSAEALINEGRAAFDAGEYQQAIDSFEAAYKLEQTIEVNLSLAASLDAAEQFEQAFRIATELPWAVYNTIDMQEHFIQVALHAKRPITARKMLAQYMGDKTSIILTINKSEEALRQNQAIKVKTMTREFYHLGEATLTEQQQRLQEFEQLPLDEYVFGAKGVLVDPFANALIRATVFASLQQLNYDEAVTVQPLVGEQTEVTPSQSPALQDMLHYQAVNEALKDEEANMDPVLWQGLAQQSQLMMQMMYPFLDVAIDNPVKWVTDMQGVMMGINEPDVTTNQGRWQEAILQAMMGFSEF